MLYHIFVAAFGVGRCYCHLADGIATAEWRLADVIASWQMLLPWSIVIGCTHSFLFWGGGEDKVCPGGGKNGSCSIAHAKRILHNKDPIRIGSTMVFQFT